MNNLKKIMKQIESSLSAVTFAESGEFETAREIINRNRKVLLGLCNYDEKVLKYAINICRRTDADLDILYACKTKTPADEEAFRNIKSFLRKEGIPYNIHQRSGDLRQEILQYTEGRTEVLFVVVGPSTAANALSGNQNKTLSSSWDRLKCPLVVVKGNPVRVGA